MLINLSALHLPSRFHKLRLFDGYTLPELLHFKTFQARIQRSLTSLCNDD